MLSVYRAYRLYDSEAKWKQLERASQFTDLKVSPKNHLFSDKIEPFGDIDAWFLSDNSVHKGGFGSWMVSAVEYGQELQEPLDLSYRLTKTSKWANSFRREEKSHSFIFQIIKTPIASVEDLFSSFDFINCCVAYHDGTLYYDSRVDESFDNFSLELNNSANYTGKSMTKRVYAGLRAFKYSKRYMLDFSPDLAELIYKIYVDIESVDYSKYSDKLTLVNDVYGTVLLPVNDFKDMVRTFEGKFKDFSRMRTFRSDYALFLVDRNELNVKEYLNQGLPSLCENIFATPF